MMTQVLQCDDASIALAARLIREGQIVAFPTETVYGLGADARREAAVRAIFFAKERPADNPLISHVVDVGQVYELAREVPNDALRLMEAFWPGPLTLVLRHRAGALPDVTRASLNTCAVRMPSHPAAKALIAAAGCPVAAPSANRSGRPSPTLARHVLEDMQGRIPLILDGGACEIGLESTVVSALDGEGVVLLRPGGVTREMLEAALGKRIRVAEGVNKPLGPLDTALSPGMKHRHYAPKARVVVAEGWERVLELYKRELADGGVPVILTSRKEGTHKRVPLGDKPEQRLFQALREADEAGATLALFEAMPREGIGSAIMNRALRAAGFEVIGGKP